MVDAYKTSQEFQTKILSMTVREPGFLDVYVDVIDPSFFTFDVLKMLSRIILDYHLHYKIVPTRTALADQAEEYIARLRIQNDREEILNTIDYIYSCDLSDGEYIKDKVISFGRTIALKRAISEVIDMLDDPNEESYLHVRDLIDQALNVGVYLKRNRFDFSLFMKNPAHYFNNIPEYDPSCKVRTPWKKINDSIGGGLGPGQLGVIMAAPGFGKSMALVNIAVGAVEEQGFPTFYFPIGDLKEHDIALRYLCNLFGMRDEDILADPPPEALINKIRKYAGRPRPLEIAYFSPATVTVQSLKSYITKVMAMNKNMRPGLIIVDYADNLVPHRNIGKGSYLEMGSIYEKMIEMGDQFGCPVWTASQPQRWGLTEELLDIERVGDSWKKIAHADVVVTINQSAAEKYEDRCRFFLAKVRRGKSKIPIDMSADYPRMRFMEV